MSTAAVNPVRTSAIDRLERPRLGAGIVERPRLFAALDDPPTPLTLVSAPAGSGKTGLALSWLAARQRVRPIAWLTARRGEDGVTFWENVAAALATALRTDDLRHPDEAALDAVLRTFVRLDTPLTLVVDDFHEVGSPLVLEPLARIAEWAPEQLQLVLVGRRDPDLPVHRLRLEGRLAEIRGRDLAFRPDEAAALFHAAGIELDADLVLSLHERTEGWAAALRFAAISLRACDDRESFVSALCRSEHAVSDYLVREVLASQPPAWRDFLLRVSLCNRVDGGLADTVTGRRDGARVLDALERDNVFVELEPDGRWYRFHPLFGELLRAHACAELAAAIPEIHGAASRWLTAEGFRLEALSHALASGDAASAAALVGELWLEIAASGDLEDLGLDRVMFDDLLDEPQLCLLAAWRCLGSGELGEADAWLAFADQMGDVDDRPFRVGRAVLALRRGQLGGEVEAVESAIARLAWPPAALRSTDEDARRALTLAARGAVALVRGDLARAENRFSTAVEQARRAGFGALEADATSSLALVCALRGQLRRAARLAGSPARTSAAGLTALAVCELEWDNSPEAQRLAERARDLAEARGDRVGALVTQIVAARALASSPDGLDDLRLRVAALAEEAPRPFPLIDAELALLRCRIALASADPMTACGLLIDTDDSPARTVGIARLAVATRDVEGARRELDALLARGEDVPLTLRVEATVLQSLVSDDEESCDWIEQALDLAEPEAVRRPFQYDGAAVAGVLRRTIRRGSAHRSLAGSILATLDGRETRVGHAPHELLEPLSDRELTVLRYLPTMMSNQEIAGELFLSVNTVKTHLKSIYRKVGVSDRRDAVRAARGLRLIG